MKHFWIILLAVTMLLTGCNDSSVEEANRKNANKINGPGRVVGQLVGTDIYEWRFDNGVRCYQFGGSASYDGALSCVVIKEDR